MKRKARPRANREAPKATTPQRGNNSGGEEGHDTAHPQYEGTTHPETHFIGDNGDMEEEGRRWGHPIILPKGEGGEDTSSQTPTGTNTDTSAPQATGWLKGLEQMDRICPRTWATRGIKAGRRIPADFRAPLL